MGTDSSISEDGSENNVISSCVVGKQEEMLDSKILNHRANVDEGGKKELISAD